jgi:hypothetical protein
MNQRFFLSTATLFLLGLSLVILPPTLAQSSDVQQATAALIADLSRPSPALQKYGPGQVTQMAVESNYAMAKWTWGEAGGIAVLSKQQGNWRVLTRRDDWIGLRGFVSLGVPQPVAQKLLDQIVPNWRSLPNE